MDQSIEKMQQRYQQLGQELATIGYILQGSIHTRVVTVDGENDQKKTRGPYYQWTFKKRGKTVTVNLSAQQAEVFQVAIDNHRRLEKILQEMRKLSLKICDAKTEGVRRRSKKSIEEFFE